MGLSRAEIQKRYRQRKGDILKEKEKERSKLRRTKQTPEIRAKTNKQALARMKKMKEKMRKEATETVSPYSRKSSKSRAVNKLVTQLPSDCEKRKTVITELVKKFNVTICPDLQTTRRGKTSEYLKVKVKSFYDREDISRMSPGRKDFVNIKLSGKKVQLQKKFLITSIKETYSMYKAEHPNDEIGKSLFYQLRPRHVSLSSNTPHNVCCCVTHENFLSLLDSLRENGYQIPIYDMHWFADNIACTAKHDVCFDGLCESCSNGDVFFSRNPIPSNGDDDVLCNYKLWTRCHNEKLQNILVTTTISEMYSSLKSSLPSFVEHHCTKRRQHEQYSTDKTNSSSRDILFHFDYSENYTCQYQDEVMSAHWNQNLVSLFTVCIYNGSHLPISVVIASDILDHSKTSTSVYLDYLIQLYSSTESQNLILWSDGPASQFKNRFMHHFCKFIQEKYLLKSVRWNFFATSHGKGSVDGVGGVTKRCVWNAVKCRSSIVKCASDFVAVAKKHLENIDVHLINDVNERFQDLDWKYFDAPIIPSIHKTHCWLITDDSTSEFRLSKQYNQTLSEDDGNNGSEIHMDESTNLSTSDWICAEFDGNWYPGKIQSIHQNNIQVDFMRRIAVNSFDWPNKPDIQTISCDSIMCVISQPCVSASTSSRIQYALLQNDFCHVTNIFERIFL